MVLEKLEKVWKKYPDQRFCQMLTNILMDDELPYFLEDDALLKKIEIFEKMLPMVNK